MVPASLSMLYAYAVLGGGRLAVVLLLGYLQLLLALPLAKH